MDWQAGFHSTLCVIDHPIDWDESGKNLANDILTGQLLIDIIYDIYIYNQWQIKLLVGFCPSTACRHLR